VKLHCYYVYILSNRYRNVFYIGVTNDLVVRCHQHSSKLNAGFTKKYNVHHLVYFELFDYVDLAIRREKQIKGYSRAKKLTVIKSINPEMVDLYIDGIVKMPDQ